MPRLYYSIFLNIFFTLCCSENIEYQYEYGYVSETEPYVEVETKKNNALDRYGSNIDLYGDPFNSYVRKNYLWAHNDDDAILKAKERFELDRQYAIREVEQIVTQKPILNYGESIPRVPFSYTLYRGTDDIDCADKGYSLRSDQDNINDSNYAYAEAKFGMSLEELRKLPHFKHFLWKPDRRMLVGIDEIGVKKYRVILMLEDEGLSRVAFSSQEFYKSSESFVNDIRNLRNVFWRAYGKPSYYSSIPEIGSPSPKVVYDWERTTIKDIDYPYHYVYEWSFPSKHVRIGYGKAKGCTQVIATMSSILWIKKKEAKIEQSYLSKKNIEQENKAKSNNKINVSAEMFK